LQRLEGNKWRARILGERFVRKALFLDPGEDIPFPTIKSKRTINVIHTSQNSLIEESIAVSDHTIIEGTFFLPLRKGNAQNCVA
jgi:hypothetical protein